MRSLRYINMYTHYKMLKTLRKKNLKKLEIIDVDGKNQNSKMSTASHLKFNNSYQNCNFKEQDKVILKFFTKE